jgi:tetratricopeptide (TPR) repeat protein
MRSLRLLSRGFLPVLLSLAFAVPVTPVLTRAQTATIAESSMIFRTYPFSDPDPVPRMGNIYPYFRFQGYSTTPVAQSWNIIVLENPFIRVMIAPEIGGKILGAQEKSTGRWFIYFNRVIKFREIAMRGPWTSGGIEFNFGDIGHAPTTSNPVDYLTRKNPDGSVSCVVGAMDLPSRTEWRVEIRLPPDRAMFETRSFWFNPTESPTSLYHWMNAAANADSSLQMLYPGTGFIGHGGEPSRWPLNAEGRDLSYYRNNNFGSYKSYHVLGSFTDFFGARWGDFGVIHYAPQTDKPGKKLWVWGLSREGEIWVNLLTDPDLSNTQYVELQSGIHFNQAAPPSSTTPFKHMQFFPNSSIRFNESWFPFKGLQGVTRATPDGALNVWSGSARLHYAFCPTGRFADSIRLTFAGSAPITRQVNLHPLQTYQDSVAIPEHGLPFELMIGPDFTYRSSEEKDRILDRPVAPLIPFDWNSAYGHATKGRELFRQREYEGALAEYLLSLKKDPTFLPALAGAAELYLRRMEEDSAFILSRRGLAIDAYDAEANYVYGLAQRRRNRPYDAMEAFGIAARSREYAPAANLQLAEMRFVEGDRTAARGYAGRALEDDRLNVGAQRLRAVLNRGDAAQSDRAIDEMLALDPLSHFARFERFRTHGTEVAQREFVDGIRNELPHETYLELAAWYHRIGLNDDAAAVLALAPDVPLVSLWRAFLASARGKKEEISGQLDRGLSRSTGLAFPHRHEDAPVLLWAESQRPHWRTKYMLALLYWSLGRRADAGEWFGKCGGDPDEAAFYMARGSFFKTDSARGRADYLHALKIAPGEWRTSYNAVNFLNEQGLHAQALSISTEAVRRFHGSYVLQFQHARTLLFNNDFAAGRAILDTLVILPFEGARYGREAFREASLLSAVSAVLKKEYDEALRLIGNGRLWPERLGAGKPYDVDTRMEDYLEAVVRNARGDRAGARRLLEAVVDDTRRQRLPAGIGTLCGALALRDLGRGKEGDAMLSAWTKREPSNAAAAWALAGFRKNIDGARRIEASGSSTVFNRVNGDQELVLMANIVRLMPM